MQLFYNSDISETTNQFVFDREESKHIVRVLRKSIGDTLYLTNGKGWLFSSRITVLDASACVVTIVSRTLQAKRSYRLHMAVALTKAANRYEWFLEKATEIGVDTIHPIICDHSERRTIKSERFEKILKAATKQSLSCFLPKLYKTISFKEFIHQNRDGHRLIAHCKETRVAPLKKPLKNVLIPSRDTTILIGPEGDFSDSEIGIAIGKGFTPVTLGSARLRTETAAIVACHSVAFINS